MVYITYNFKRLQNSLFILKKRNNKLLRKKITNCDLANELFTKTCLRILECFLNWLFDTNSFALDDYVLRMMMMTIQFRAELLVDKGKTAILDVKRSFYFWCLSTVVRISTAITDDIRNKPTLLIDMIDLGNKAIRTLKAVRIILGLTVQEKILTDRFCILLCFKSMSKNVILTIQRFLLIICSKTANGF